MIVKLIVGIVIAILFVVWVTSFVGFIAGTYVTPYFFAGSKVFNFISSAALWSLFAVPLFFVILTLVRAVSRQKIPRNVKIGGLALFMLALLITVFTGIKTGKDFEKESTFRSEEAVIPLSTKHLEFDFYDNSSNRFDIDLNDFVMGKNALYIERQQMEIMLSPDSNFHYAYSLSARGKDNERAGEYIHQWKPEWEAAGSTLELPKYFKIPKGGKFRDQKLTHRIYVPEGGSIRFKDIQNHIHRIYFNGSAHYYGLGGTEWLMKNGKFQKVNVKSNG